MNDTRRIPDERQQNNLFEQERLEETLDEYSKRHQVCIEDITRASVYTIGAAAGSAVLGSMALYAPVHDAIRVVASVGCAVSLAPTVVYGLTLRDFLKEFKKNQKNTEYVLSHIKK